MFKFVKQAEPYLLVVVEKLIKVIDLKPDFEKPYNNIDVIYFSKNGYPTPLQNYKKPITINSKDNNALNMYQWYAKKSGRLKETNLFWTGLWN